MPYQISSAVLHPLSSRIWCLQANYQWQMGSSTMCNLDQRNGCQQYCLHGTYRWSRVNSQGTMETCKNAMWNAFDIKSIRLICFDARSATYANERQELVYSVPNQIAIQPIMLHAPENMDFTYAWEPLVAQSTGTSTSHQEQIFHTATSIRQTCH